MNPLVSKRWTSDIGKLVCPLVHFSNDSMIWLVRRYDPYNNSFKDDHDKAVFRLSERRIREAFKLREGGKLLNLDFLEKYWAFVTDSRIYALFDNDVPFYGQDSFPISSFSLKY